MTFRVTRGKILLLSFIFCLLSLILIFVNQILPMALNYIWIAFFLIGFLVALGQLIFAGNTQIFTDLVNAVFSNAKTGFEISLGLTGALTLWMGLLRVGEKEGDEIKDSELFGSFANTGFIAQNVYLFCASANLGCVIRGLVPKDKLAPEMGLKSNQVIILSQTVGVPMK